MHACFTLALDKVILISVVNQCATDIVHELGYKKSLFYKNINKRESLLFLCGDGYILSHENQNDGWLLFSKQVQLEQHG